MIAFKTPEEAYINYYVTEKEKDLPLNIRKYLNHIYYIHKIKKLDLLLAIHIIAKKYKKKNNDESKSLEEIKYILFKLYQKRRAYVSNGKQEYRRLQKEKDRIIEPNYCACGCGEVVKKKNKFVNGHNIRCRTKEQKNSYAKNMRKFCSKNKNKDL